MAQSPKYIETTGSDGRKTRMRIRYVRTSRQTVAVRFCWLYLAGISHSCDEFGCWKDEA